MNQNHIQTLLVLAERARQAGLIQFDEMLPVLEAINAAKEAIKPVEKEAVKPDKK